MKNKKLTVTIGIPAYNEEINIKFLLETLLKQEVKGAKLNEMIVISDGSKDNTVNEARTIKNPCIKIISHAQRSGQLSVQNKIIELAKGDILVLLNADVLPIGNHFIEEITKPIIEDRDVGLVGADTVSAKPNNFMESIIAVSHELKNSLFRKINKSNNIYLCHGRARAFSRKFYKQIHWPKNAPEDAYSYILCLQKGFKFVFTPKAKVIFRSPSTLSDHFKQSNRFVKGEKELERYFPGKFVKKQYSYSKLLLAQTIIEYLLKNPIAVFSYIAVTTYIRLFGIKKEVKHTKWDISPTTKRIVYEKV